MPRGLDFLDELLLLPHPELLIYVNDVGMGRARRNAQALCDHRLSATAGQQAKHLGLAWGAAAPLRHGGDALFEVRAHAIGLIGSGYRAEQLFDDALREHPNEQDDERQQ